MNTIHRALDGLLASRYAQAALVFAVSFLVYFNSIFNGFVYDDTYLIVNNPWLRDPGLALRAFVADSWAFMGEGGSGYYRPLMTLFYSLDYHLFGMNPLGFHLSFVLLHSAVSAAALYLFHAVFEMAYGEKTFKEGLPGSLNDTFKGAPLAAALLFATHPVHTQVVAWNAVHEMSLTLFAILTVYFHIKGRPLAAVLCFLVAAFSKETAAVVPIIIFAYDWSVLSLSLPAAFKEKVRFLALRYVPYIIAGLAYMALRSYALGAFSPVRRHGELAGFDYVLNSFPLFADYLVKLIMPVKLNPTHVFHPVAGVTDPRVLYGMAVTGCFIWALVFLRRRAPFVFFSLILVAAPLLPVMYIPAMGVHVFAENYLYLPSAGFVLLLAAALFKVGPLCFGRQRSGVAVLVSLMAILIVYSASTVTRNLVWRNDFALWSDTVKKSPDSSVVRNNLGLAYFKASREEEAISEYKAALEIYPAFPEALNNLGVSYFKLGNQAEAVVMFNMAIKSKPNFADAHYNLGLAYGEMGRTEEAFAEVRKAMDISSRFAAEFEAMRK